MCIRDRLSTVQQTASSLTSRISNAEGELSTVKQTASSLTSRISNAEGDISTVEQTAKKINWVIASGSSSSNFTLTSRMANLVAEQIELTGYVDVYKRQAYCLLRAELDRYMRNNKTDYYMFWVDI